MQTSKFILTLSILFLASCGEQTNSSNSVASFVDTTKTFKREIPKFENGDFDLFYNLTKGKQNQLGLDSLENGFDNLQIRVWYEFSLIQKRKLIVITNKGTNWTATVYNMQVDWNGETETIVAKEVRQLAPKSGWAIFSKRLLDLKVLILPNMDEISGLEDNWKDGVSYNVEVATKMQYRFYSYHLPDQFQDKFWQAKNMNSILKLFEEELGVRQEAQARNN